MGRFVAIPGGTYDIGSPATEADRYLNENRHQIKLSPYFIMEAAVTQGFYYKIMGCNPSHFKAGADYPVEMVNWHDANKFAKILSAQDSKYTYSLPTEAQLEVAFRGGTKTAYVTGRDDKVGLGDYVWYEDNSNKQTHPVKSKLANGYGIYHSSVWEWTNDWYDENYTASTGLDPQGPTSGRYRVFRGGSWGSKADRCRSAYRFYDRSDWLYEFLGFRLVRTRK
jgi:formylglycine-generating enzyme required for sulfatase activity